MQVEHRVSINASPERIFEIYREVAKWNTWDVGTKSAAIGGPFEAGTRGQMTQFEGNAIPMVLTKVAEGKSFTFESRISHFRMEFDRELHADGDVTCVVHRVSFSGLLSAVIAPLVAKRINAGLPTTLNNLKRLAEGQRASKASNESVL